VLTGSGSPHQQIGAALLTDHALDSVIEDERPRHLLHGPKAPHHADLAVALSYLDRAGLGAERQRLALHLGAHDFDAICPADRDLPKHFTEGPALEPEDDRFGDVEGSAGEYPNRRVESISRVGLRGGLADRRREEDDEDARRHDDGPPERMPHGRDHSRDDCRGRT
jgi:hypothetical protein